MHIRQDSEDQDNIRIVNYTAALWKILECRRVALGNNIEFSVSYILDRKRHWSNQSIPDWCRLSMCFIMYLDMCLGKHSWLNSVPRISLSAEVILTFFDGILPNLAIFILVYVSSNHRAHGCWRNDAVTQQRQTCANVIYSSKARFYCRADSRFAPSQWETALLCNDVSHWLGVSLESVLYWQGLVTLVIIGRTDDLNLPNATYYVQIFHGVLPFPVDVILTFSDGTLTNWSTIILVYVSNNHSPYGCWRNDTVTQQRQTYANVIYNSKARLH